MLEFEELKPKISMIGTEKACNFGEWPGITSSKWNSSIKVLRPIVKEEVFDSINLFIQIGIKRFYQEDIFLLSQA